MLRRVELEPSRGVLGALDEVVELEGVLVEGAVSLDRRVRCGRHRELKVGGEELVVPEVPLESFTNIKHWTHSKCGFRFLKKWLPRMTLKKK